MNLGEQYTQVSTSVKAVVPNLFGTRDQFHGRQFFLGLWWWWRGDRLQDTGGTGRREAGDLCFKAHLDRDALRTMPPEEGGISEMSFHLLLGAI